MPEGTSKFHTSLRMKESLSAVSVLRLLSLLLLVLLPLLLWLLSFPP